jgi:hypothetical protein
MEGHNLNIHHFENISQDDGLSVGQEMSLFL